MIDSSKTSHTHSLTSKEGARFRRQAESRFGRDWSASDPYDRKYNDNAHDNNELSIDIKDDSDYVVVFDDDDNLIFI